MSHVSLISNVPVKDIYALQMAVEELAEQGLNIRMIAQKDLEGNTNPDFKGPRLYNSQQMKQYAKCAYTIQLPKANYDIGVNEVKDDDKNFLRYDLLTDFWAGSVASQLGTALPSEDDRSNEFSLGKLMQRYTKYAIVNASLKQSRSVGEITMDAHGDIHLEIEVA